ncbi:unnamed protein product [Brassicogethes aeneus]|uniref:Uncharacterized protein n=1 Tax=Brassicogethes aeneus TaxID=1431903 RepID=A0A9P0BEW0_BRAAE|nr:unnamed protein product [Brassicogethes aeneus]
MADKGKEPITKQEFETAISAADQGEIAGPQASLSYSNGLAMDEYNTRGRIFCNKSLDYFCVVCGKYVVSKHRKKFTDVLKTMYMEFFGIETVEMNNHWTPKMICLRCYLQVNKKKKRTFASPMIWREPINHETDCYFCLTRIFGHSRKSKSYISYASVESVTFPILLDAEQSNISPDENEDIMEMSADEVLSYSDAEDVEMKGETSEESAALRRIICIKKLDYFCVVCGKYVVTKHRKKFTDVLKTMYREFFGIETVEMDNHWTPKMICLKCYLQLNKQKRRTFASPMIWREPINHETDCYFCLTRIFGHSRKSKSSISYASVDSVTFPILLDAGQSNISPDENEDTMEMSADEVSSDGDAEDVKMKSETSEESEDETDENPNGFTQEELNDLVRDAGLSKEISELIANVQTSLGYFLALPSWYFSVVSVKIMDAKSIDPELTVVKYVLHRNMRQR